MTDQLMTPYENEPIETMLVRALIDQGCTVSTVESCTGGMIAARLVNVPGASETFMEGFVTYSNTAKERAVGVSHETLAAFGAVSPETCREMCQGGARTAATYAAIASTGIAGPGGGTIEKPVGLVYVGAVLKDKTQIQRLHLKGSRLSIRTQAAEAAMRLLYEMLNA